VVKLEQLEKQYSPIDVTELPMVIFANLEQEEKQDSRIYVTELGMVISDKLVQF